MNYTINISDHLASLFINQEDDETETEFLERVKQAEGKHFVAFRVIDIRKGSQKQFQMQSPYFTLDNAEERDAVITATFEALGKAVVANETRKAAEPAPATVVQSGLILPPGFGNS